MDKSGLKIIGITVFMTMFSVFISGCKGESTAQEKAKADRKDEVENKENRVSPLASASGVIGGNKVTVNYSSPRVKGRVIWGGLVPYDEIWRTGANEATVVEITKDVLVEGQLLRKDVYSLFTKPTADVWTVIFNLNEKQWGAFKYDVADDALRVNLKPVMLDSLQEELKFEVLNDATADGGIIRLLWEKLQLDIHFKNAPEN